MEACEERGRKAVSNKPQLARSSRSSNRTLPGGRRRWLSSSADLDTEGSAAAAAMLSRSYSTTAAVAAAADAVDGGGGVRQQARGGGEGEQHRRRRGAGARLSRKIKEQRARFYIVRRCVSMLVCWHDDADDADY
ncbi:hypothetical protein PAHAL_3G090100 [Panicum hallii]|uniref:Uncharacterized protein n=1 Tax=Panicum hallii TaxID=206008 RepID=A0A2S3H7E1_9POAL|nr:hypothetical protein PAHAL_3G090100 [Panicum hallii]